MRLISLLAATLAFGQTTSYKAVLTWDDALNPPGVTYKVERADGSDCSGSPSFALKASGLAARTWTDQPIAPGKYCYRVTATVDGADSAGNPTAPAVVPAFAPSGIGVTIQLTITTPAP